jgi:capsular polysaccharide biosynthesis protein
MNPEFNLISVIRTLLKWKFHIAVVTIFAAIAAVIITVFIMDPYYQSFAIVYPVNQSMGDRGALFGSEGIDAEDYYYGSKHDANRIITIATSSTLVQYIINKYNLTEHYDYAGEKYEASNTTEEFMENYQVYKTDKEAIRINLIDTDAQLAADIVNDVVETIANETTRPIAANKEKLADLFEAQAKAKKNQMDSLLTVLLSSKGQDDIYNVRNMQYTRAVEEYNEIRLLADQYALAVQQNMSGIEVIEYAYKAERKLKPVRSKICIATTMLAFILACLGAIGIEQVNYIKEELAKS